jgi:hypothetical protein
MTAVRATSIAMKRLFRMFALLPPRNSRPGYAEVKGLKSLGLPA